MTILELIRREVQELGFYCTPIARGHSFTVPQIPVAIGRSVSSEQATLVLYAIRFGGSAGAVYFDLAEPNSVQRLLDYVGQSAKEAAP